MAGRRAVCVGAGITGVLVARELSLAGWDVTVLEAKHVGAGSSSRTAAGIRQQFSTPETVRGMRYAVRFYRAFQDEVEGRQSPIVQSGYLFLHRDPARWADAIARAAMQRSCGLEVDVLEGAALRDAFPWAAEDLVGGTFCATDGFLLPHLVYTDGARRVRELGGALVQNAPVVGVEADGARLTAVITPNGRYEADLFLDCTNAWTGRVGEVLGGEPLPVDPIKRYLWFLARDGALTEDELARMPLVIGPDGVYARPENRGSLLMGKAHPTAPEPSFDDEDQDRIDAAFSHTAGADGAAVQAWLELSEAIPAVGEFAGLTATTSGFYGTTPDHNPFLGYDPRRPNLIRLVGFSGHGAMFGPFTAAVARALAEAGRDVPEIRLDGETIGISAFRIGRPLGHAEQMVI